MAAIKNPTRSQTFQFWISLILLSLITSWITLHWSIGHKKISLALLFQMQVWLLPMYSLFLAISFFFPYWLSISLISLFALLLNIGNKIKYSLTFDVVNFNDLADMEQVAIIRKYLTFTHGVLLLAFVLCFVVGIFFVLKKKKKSHGSPQKTNRFHFFLKLSIILILLHLSFYPFYLSQKNSVGMDLVMEKIGIKYNSWTSVRNINKNGIYFHVIQSSIKKSPPELTEQDRLKYHAMEKPSSTLKGPKHIVFVLCEACWFDEKNFKEEFAPLLQSKFQHTEVISPVYGGHTVNASFEMLVSLPVKNLTAEGIIYPEYANSFSDHANTLVRTLKNSGYRTVSLHNWNRSFFRRNVVLPKLGFDEFHSVETMNCEKEYFPNDKCLFDYTLKYFKEHHAEKLFLNLDTVYTHGDYKFKNDSGENHYRTRLKETIAEFRKFADQISAIDDDVVFVLYGDHKPALTKYFFEHGVFAPSMFRKTGSVNAEFEFNDGLDWKKIGAVPMFIYSPKHTKEVERTIKRISNQPLYCVSSILNDELLHANYMGARFVHDLCDHNQLDYTEQYQKVPASLYTFLLFDS
jgi:phosphoglycerol transferase MdoB-like AlkP superfamily enzyme